MGPGHCIFVRALTLGFLYFGGFLEVPYVRTTQNLFFVLASWLQLGMHQVEAAGALLFLRESHPSRLHYRGGARARIFTKLRRPNCPNILIRQTELPKCVLVLGFLCAFHLMLIAQLCAPCYGTEVYRSYMHTPNISHQWAQECFFMCLRSVSHFWSKECLPALKHCSLIRAFLLTCMPAHFAY